MSTHHCKCGLYSIIHPVVFEIYNVHFTFAFLLWWSADSPLPPRTHPHSDCDDENCSLGFSVVTVHWFIYSFQLLHFKMLRCETGDLTSTFSSRAHLYSCYSRPRGILFLSGQTNLEEFAERSVKLSPLKSDRLQCIVFIFPLCAKNTLLTTLFSLVVIFSCGYTLL